LIQGSTSFWFGVLLNVIHIKQEKSAVGFVHLFRYFVLQKLYNMYSTS